MTGVEAICAAWPIAKGAGHSFGCDRRGSYDKANSPQQRTQEFFAEHLTSRRGTATGAAELR